MTPAEEALRDAWLAECWAPVHEVHSHIRAEQRKADRAQQRALEEMAAEAVHNPSTVGPDLPTSLSTGCAENGAINVPEAATNGPSGVGELLCRPHESTPGPVARTAGSSRGLAS